MYITTTTHSGAVVNSLAPSAGVGHVAGNGAWWACLSRRDPFGALVAQAKSVSWLPPMAYIAHRPWAAGTTVMSALRYVVVRLGRVLLGLHARAGPA